MAKPVKVIHSPRPAVQVGMGAVPYAGGTAFRVWAPHAERVFVAGDFNEWSPDGAPLAAEANGYWSLNVPGVRVGAKYKFRVINGEQELWKIDPFAREVTNSTGEAVVCDTSFDWDADDYRTPPWHEMVIYELHVGTFNAAPETLPATFDDAIQRLVYLRELGINVVEVMPPMEFPGSLSWGYNPAHLFAIDNDYGGPQAFKRFVKAAHEQGIAVVLDVVYNHFGPGDLDLWRFDGWSENDRGGIYFYNDDRAVTPWGHTRPDYGRDEVRQYIRDNVLMWLEDYHLDGVRLDATAYIRSVNANDQAGDDLPDGWSLLQWINDEIDARQPWKITIAEDLRTNTMITTPVEDGGAGFDAQWDPAFVYPVRDAIITQDDANRDVQAVAGAIQFRYGADAFQRVIYTESHDEVANGKKRVPEEIWPENAGSSYAKKRSTLGAALVMTSPGIPMIFQGQEFLSDAWFEDNRPLDWAKLDQFQGIHQMYSDLIKLRRNWDGTTRGLSGQHVAVFHRDEAAKVLAFHRWHEGGPCDSVVVVVNLTCASVDNYTIGMPAEGTWQVRFNSDWSGYDAEFTDYPTAAVTAVAAPCDDLPCSATFGIGPYSVVIFSQDAPE